jgi:hypothetical protein
MRAVRHARFGDELAKPSFASDEVPRTSLSPQLRNSSVEEFEVAQRKRGLIGAQAGDQPGLPLL